jgi:hypothetical protein
MFLKLNAVSQYTSGRRARVYLIGEPGVDEGGHRGRGGPRARGGGEMVFEPAQLRIEAIGDGGFEQATGYSELVDPVVQRERFMAQMELAKSGDPEAMKLDEEFLKALEFGMPPSGGMGMGIDRLLMALTGLGIRETILFPLVK